MKYHVIPLPRFVQVVSEKDFPKEGKAECKSLERELRESLKKWKKSGEHDYGELFFLGDSDSLGDLSQLTRSGDEIVVHGAGTPSAIGLEIFSKYDLLAFEVAQIFQKHQLIKPNMTINFLTCNSAVSCAEGLNFAQDFSRALAFLGCPDVKVEGYTGYVRVKGSGGKYSVSSVLEGRDSKGTHASLANAKRIYQAGCLITQARQILIKDGTSFLAACEPHLADIKTFNQRIEQSELAARKKGLPGPGRPQLPFLELGYGRLEQLPTSAAERAF